MRYCGSSGHVRDPAVGFLTLFKMWPAVALSKPIGRELYMKPSAKEAAANLFTLAAISSVFGYFTMAVDDAALGYPPRNPLQPVTAMAVLAQGGGLGILGDFLFGEINRMGGGLVSTLGAPVVSDADMLVKLFDRFRSDLTDLSNQHRNGRFCDIWPDLAPFAVRHVPFSNMLDLKGTLDYLLWYHLYEAASPGWWDRTNRRLIKEQGRAMTGYTPGDPVPYGVPWLHLQNRQGKSFGLASRRT